MQKENISVKDIAEMAGTSVATVSRVLNQNGRFSKETEERVMKIVRQYHYKPNQLARGLRVQQTKVIGILVPDITNAFFAAITQAVQNELIREGYMTLICSTNEDAEAARKQINMLLGQKVSGVIYIGQNKIPADTAVPTVYIDREPAGADADGSAEYAFIECDNRQGGYLAGSELIRKGARRIAYMYFNGELSTIRSRRQGLLDALAEHGMEADAVTEVPVKMNSIEEGARATEELMRGENPPDGIFYTSDQLAIGGLNALQRGGIRVPEEVRIVGFDDTELCRAVYPAITSVHQPTDEIGRMAAQHILQQISGSGPLFGKQKVPVSLMVRDTT